jgi:hypothetical protein
MQRLLFILATLVSSRGRKGKSRIEHVLEPRGMWALEVKLDERPEPGTAKEP